MHLQTCACLAATLAQAGQLPAKLNLIVPNLMILLRKDGTGELQPVAAAALAELVLCCISRDPGPNPKVRPCCCCWGGGTQFVQAAWGWGWRLRQQGRSNSACAKGTEGYVLKWYHAWCCPSICMYNGCVCLVLIMKPGIPKPPLSLQHQAVDDAPLMLQVIKNLVSCACCDPDDTPSPSLTSL